jgi:hypothetical protein
VGSERGASPSASHGRSGTTVSRRLSCSSRRRLRSDSTRSTRGSSERHRHSSVGANVNCAFDLATLLLIDGRGSTSSRC